MSPSTLRRSASCNQLLDGLGPGGAGPSGRPHEPIAQLWLRKQLDDLYIAPGRLRFAHEAGEGHLARCERAVLANPEGDEGVCVKSFKPFVFSEADDLEELIRAAKSLSRLKHRNMGGIIGLGAYDCTTMRELRQTIYLVEEWAGTLTMRKVVMDVANKPYTPEDALRWSVQMARALLAMHSRNMSHADVKLENIHMTGKGEGSNMPRGSADAMLVDLKPYKHVLTRTLAARGKVKRGSCLSKELERRSAAHTDPLSVVSPRRRSTDRRSLDQSSEGEGSTRGSAHRASEDSNGKKADAEGGAAAEAEQEEEEKSHGWKRARWEGHGRNKRRGSWCEAMDVGTYLEKQSRHQRGLTITSHLAAQAATDEVYAAGGLSDLKEYLREVHVDVVVMCEELISTGSRGSASYTASSSSDARVDLESTDSPMPNRRQAMAPLPQPSFKAPSGKPTYYLSDGRPVTSCMKKASSTELQKESSGGASALETAGSVLGSQPSIRDDSTLSPKQSSTPRRPVRSSRSIGAGSAAWRAASNAGPAPSVTIGQVPSIKPEAEKRVRFTLPAAADDAATNTDFSLLYRAPELLDRPRNTGSAAGDVFSLAIVMYELLRKRCLSPVDNDDKQITVAHLQEYAERVRQGHREALPSEWPQAVRSLLGSMWAQDPNARPQARDLVETLQAMQKDQGVLSSLRGPEVLATKAKASQGCACVIC